MTIRKTSEVPISEDRGDWVLVDAEKDTWMSPILRKYVGKGDPKEYRAFFCQVCGLEIPEISVHWSKGELHIPFHWFNSKKHFLKMSTKHPTCQVYACPICGMPADPSLFGYCCNQHRTMMMKRLAQAAGVEDGVLPSVRMTQSARHVRNTTVCDVCQEGCLFKIKGKKWQCDVCGRMWVVCKTCHKLMVEFKEHQCEKCSWKQDVPQAIREEMSSRREANKRERIARRGWEKKRRACGLPVTDGNYAAHLAKGTVMQRDWEKRQKINNLPVTDDDYAAHLVRLRKEREERRRKLRSERGRERIQKKTVEATRIMGMT